MDSSRIFTKDGIIHTLEGGKARGKYKFLAVFVDTFDHEDEYFWYNELEEIAMKMLHGSENMCGLVESYDLTADDLFTVQVNEHRSMRFPNGMTRDEVLEYGKKMFGRHDKGELDLIVRAMTRMQS